MITKKMKHLSDNALKRLWNTLIFRRRDDNSSSYYLFLIVGGLSYHGFMFKAVYQETRGEEYPDNLEGDIP